MWLSMVADQHPVAVARAGLQKPTRRHPYLCCVLSRPATCMPRWRADWGLPSVVVGDIPPPLEIDQRDSVARSRPKAAGPGATR